MSDQNKPRGYLAKYGDRLISGGYEIIPIQRGAKHPPATPDMKNWQKIRATKKELRGWIDGKHARCGVGILARKTPFVDLDILDEEMALAMEAFVREQFGDAPLRIGMAPKRGLAFRTDKPFPKINSKTYEDEWADPNAAMSHGGKPVGHLRKVEILGDGQQFVAFAVHPDTGSPYKWIGPSLATVKWEDLPILTHEDGLAIVEEFHRLCEARGWEEAKGSRALARLQPTGPSDFDDPFAADTDRVNDLDDEEIRRLLMLVPGAEDHDTWFQIGMALYHQFDGSDEGLALWHEWSAEAHNYDSDALEARWPTFDIAEKGRAPVTARLIIKLAAAHEKEVAEETFKDFMAALREVESTEALRKVCDKVKQVEFDVLQRTQIIGLVQKRFKEITSTPMAIGAARGLVAYERPRNEDAPKWTEGWVYMTHTASFYNTGTKKEFGERAFDRAFGRYMLTPVERLEGKSVPETLPSQYVLHNLQITVVDNMMYLPGEDEFFHYQRRPYVNTYSDDEVPERPRKLSRDERQAIKTVEDHVAFLFADEKDRRVLLDAMAFLVQNPGKRLNWAILMQGTEGDGKSFFYRLMAAVLGSRNVRNLQAQNVEEKFNGWAEGSQFVFFEEIKLHGHNRFDVLNKVKPLLTNVTVSVRRMNTDVYESLNTVTYFLTTNFRDALPLDDNDTRYFILFSRFQTKRALERFLLGDPTYFDRLHDALEHPGALRRWLMDWEISPSFSNVRRAPQSKARTEMISYAKTEEQEAIEELIANSTRIDICSAILDATALVDELFEENIVAPQTNAMNRMLLSLGFTLLGRVRIGGRKGSIRRMWSREPELWTDELGFVDNDRIRAWIESDL
jgi:hypothetical protein